MTKAKNTTDIQGAAGGEKEKLSPAVHTFLEVTRRLDEAVRKKNRQAVEMVRGELRVFYGSLPLEQREEIETFARREVLGRVIEDQRGRFYRTVVRALHWPHRLVGATVEPIAKLSYETVRLIITTLGWAVGGVVHGVRDAVRGVLHKAA